MTTTSHFCKFWLQECIKMYLLLTSFFSPQDSKSSQMVNCVWAIEGKMRKLGHKNSVAKSYNHMILSRSYLSDKKISKLLVIPVFS